jgi:putative transposase
MPRRARLSIAGIPWHIIQRGNNHSACFYADRDYQRYLATLREQAEKHGCRVHAYVLMTNHVHLLITPERKDSAALLMKHLGQRYVQYINRTYKRSGTLWEGRFRSCLAQSANYVLACYRYIELNPVRASMVTHPLDYPWSSYRTNARGMSSELITPHEEYLALGRCNQSRRSAYRDLFNVDLKGDVVGEIRVSTNGNFALGNEGFKQEISARLGRRVTPARAGRPFKSK